MSGWLTAAGSMLIVLFVHSAACLRAARLPKRSFYPLLLHDSACSTSCRLHATEEQGQRILAVAACRSLLRAASCLLVLAIH